jgi:hypothetical protein
LVILMKIKGNIIVIVFVLILGTSCKNSLNVQAPYKDVTVVYGLIDQNDPIHYFRINKGFEGVGNAYSMASQFDSIYYLPTSTITAILQDSNTTTNIVTAIPLDTTTSIPLSPGTFSYPKQILYKTNAALNTNDYYNLLITNTKTNKIIRGSTQLLPDVDFTGNFIGAHILSLSSNPYYTEISWNTAPNARIYQMSLLFYYDNQSGTGPRVLQSPLQLVFAEQTAPNTTGGLTMEYDFNAQQLFTLIVSSIQPEAGVTRYPDSLGVVFTTGTDDLNTYIQLSQPPSGINQDIPSFSDLTNGVGLYTARHVETFYKGIDAETLDSITGPNAEQRFLNLGFLP